MIGNKEMRRERESLTISLKSEAGEDLYSAARPASRSFSRRMGLAQPQSGSSRTGSLPTRPLPTPPTDTTMIPNLDCRNGLRTQTALPISSWSLF